MGHSSPLVSVVVNNFNYARFLPVSIGSALGQTYARVEVVAVDDASSDGSREVIGGFADRVIPVLQEHNGGQGAALNAGFYASHGEIVVFLDADDYLYPTALERVVSAWAAGVSKVQYRLDLVEADGRPIDLYPPPEVRFDSGDVVPRLLATGRYETAVTSGNAFARAVLEQILPIPEAAFRIAADGYLVTVAPFFGPVVSIDEPLGAYRQHGDNSWSSDGSAVAGRLRRSLQHDAHKYDALRAAAGRARVALTARPGLRDHQHLATRLASLVLDPAGHPHRGDSRAALAWRGFASSRDARLPWKRRLLLAAWFLAAGFLPRRPAARVIAWRLFPASRDPRVARLLKAVRRLAR